MHIKNEHSKLNIIIYGLGQRFRDFLDQGFLLEKILDLYNIIAVSDKREFTEKEKRKWIWPFVNREDIAGTKCDLILITSEIYYKEIKKELVVEYHLNNKQFVSVNDLSKKIYDNLIHTNLFENKKGVEIGGPTDFFSQNIYNVCISCDGVNFSDETEWWKKEDNVYSFQGKKLGQIIIADATKLINIPDEKYDFCISSNNLEHIANPLKALFEFRRIIKMGGILFIIVPMKSKCFDHNRDFTSFEHILEDYKSNVKESDLSHLPEILKKHDYKMDIPCGGKEKFYLRSKNNLENRCLHHHVFSVLVLERMFNYLDMEIIESGSLSHDYYILGKKG